MMADEALMLMEPFDDSFWDRFLVDGICGNLQMLSKDGQAPENGDERHQRNNNDGIPDNRSLPVYVPVVRKNDNLENRD